MKVLAVTFTSSRYVHLAMKTLTDGALLRN